MDSCWSLSTSYQQRLQNSEERSSGWISYRHFSIIDVVTFCDLEILSVEEELLQHQDVVVPEDWVKGKYLQDTNSAFF